MTKCDIIDQAARDRLVESVILAVTRRRSLPQDLQDLAQMVYVALLESTEETIADIHAKGQLRQYVAGIVIRQIWSERSTWHYLLLHRLDNKRRPLEDAMNVPDEP